MEQTNHKFLFLYLLLSTFAVLQWGCRKDVEIFTPFPSSEAELVRSLAEVPDAASHTVFTLSGAVPDTVLVTASGMRVWLTDTEHLFAEKNAPLNLVPCSTCTELTIDVSEALNKSDMIGKGVHTLVGTALHESGGIAKISISCGGKPLGLQSDRYLRVQFPVPTENDLKTDLKVYLGKIKKLDVFSEWADGNKIVYNAQWGNQADPTFGYDVFMDSLGWVSASRPVEGTASQMCVTLPSEFTRSNTKAYLVFDDKRAILPLAEGTNGKDFCFDHVPVGFGVKLVTVSNIGNHWWLGRKETETGTNSTVSLAPVEMSETDVQNALKGL